MKSSCHPSTYRAHIFDSSQTPQLQERTQTSYHLLCHSQQYSGSEHNNGDIHVFNDSQLLDRWHLSLWKQTGAKAFDFDVIDHNQ